MSGGQTTSQSGSEVLHKLKEKAFNTDMIQLLENDTSAAYGIKDLLKQIDVVHASPEVADLVIDLGLLIDCVVANLTPIREASNKIQTKSETQIAEWEAPLNPLRKVRSWRRLLRKTRRLKPVTKRLKLGNNKSRVANQDRQG